MKHTQAGNMIEAQAVRQAISSVRRCWRADLFADGGIHGIFHSVDLVLHARHLLLPGLDSAGQLGNARTPLICFLAQAGNLQANMSRPLVLLLSTCNVDADEAG